jgi:hypothetical protein
MGETWFWVGPTPTPTPWAAITIQLASDGGIDAEKESEPEIVSAQGPTIPAL